jgi:amidase
MAVGERSAWLEEGKPVVLSNALELLFEFMGMDKGYSVNRILKESNTKQVSPYMEWAMGNTELYESPSISPKNLAGFYAKLNAFRSEVSTVFHEADIILCPVGTTPAPLLTTDVSDLEKSHLSYTCPYNIMGWPAAVVRIGTSENGLPVGIQIVGKPWKEHQVLAVAKFLESEFGGFQPPKI